MADFARDLSRATGDAYYKDEFRDLNALHVNFYDGILDETFPQYLARAERFIRRLAELLPPPPRNSLKIEDRPQGKGKR
ncbi:MAG: hypothetical protein ACPLPT_08920 [Moorellales bacterium]